MVTTRSGSGGVDIELEGRPLTALDVDEEGRCWFLIDRTADWIDQVRSGPATVSGGDLSDGTWFSGSGDALLVDDRARMGQLWTPMAEAWFDGVDDPRLIALAVRVHTLAWWESADNRLVRLWKMATAAVGRGRGDAGDHGVDTVAPTDAPLATD